MPLSELGSTYVTVGAEMAPMNKAFSSIRSKLDALSSKRFNIPFPGGGGLLRLFGPLAAGAGLGMEFKNAISGAADLGKSLSKVDVIFGDSANVIVAEADRMAAKFGTVKQQFIDASSSFGSMFKGAGATQADAAALGNQLTKLGIDLASLNNKTDEETFTAMAAAMRGEFDPLERLNIFINAHKVEQEALASGLARTKGEIDDYAKKMATLNLIVRQSADAEGDRERMMDSSKNTAKELSDRWANMTTEIGQKLEPAWNSLIHLFSEMVKDFAGGKDKITGKFQAFVDFVKGAVDTLSTIYHNWGNSIKLIEILVA